MGTELEKRLAAAVAHELETGTLKRVNYQPAFMLAREDVMAAMNAGFDLKNIWEHMRATRRIPFRYETFLKYVRRYITKAPARSGITESPKGR